MIFNPTPSQKLADEAVGRGENVFVTGPGGVGKSYMIQMLSRRKGTAITSSTAISAGNIGGATFHSWMGAGLGLDSASRMFAKLSQAKRSSIRAASAVIVDEVSTIHPTLLDKTNEVCKKVRSSDKPFGGLQVIAVGDFFQLPSINENKRDRETYYAFESEAWEECDFRICHLTEMMRQDDEEFQQILNAVRTGEVEGVDFDPLYNRHLPDVRTRKGEFTVLDSHNKGVDEHNDKILEELPGKGVKFVSEDKGHEFLVKNSNLPRLLSLKVGARCLYLFNEAPLFNGSVGTIVDFEGGQPVFLDETSKREFIVDPIKREVFQGVESCWVTETARPGIYATDDGEEFHEDDVKGGQITRPRVIASRRALPLRLGYAISIHKSQGMGISALHARVSRCFAFGQLYTALSRARTLRGLTTSEIRSFSVNPKVRKFYGLD